MIVDYKDLSNYLKKQEGGAVISDSRHHKNNLEERIRIYKSVDKILSKVSNYECLEKYANEKYKIRDIINLDKKIGSKSKYGVIFLSTIVDKSHKFFMVSKVMKNDRSNDNEIILMKRITSEVLVKKKSKHFVFLYKYFICEKANVPTNKRLLSINELATGDIKTLFQNKIILNKDELLMNMFFQTFISIGTFQNLINHVHKDTHYGNFLYQENYETGYYHYIFKKKSYYLKACEYNIMLYDFGFAMDIDFLNKMSKRNSKYIQLDYLRICNAYLNKKDGWGEYYELPKIQFNNNILSIMTVIQDIQYDNQSDYFEKLLTYVLIPYSPEGMFLTNRPAKVINAKPFNID
jgi:hypothetical protein